MLVIYSKLSVTDGDRDWIERIRRSHDPQQRLVGAHCTFVFPFRGASADEVIAHAARITGTAAPIQFRLSRPAVVKDASGPATHLFLLPTKGAKKMRALHAQLYSGILAPYLHPKIPFLPHVTVGAFDQEADAKNAADDLGQFDIPGVLTGLSVAEFDGRAVVDLRELPFRG